MVRRYGLKKYAIFQKKTSRRVNRKTTDQEKYFFLSEKQLSQYLAVFTHITATVFTGTIFIGGSYLFFIQLAEYGW